MAKDEFKSIREQAVFCAELMHRLEHSIVYEKTESQYYGGMKNYIQKQNDIRRLRRELLELCKRLDPWREK